MTYRPSVQPPATYEVRQLTSRCDTELGEDVREMGAHRARRDVERGSDLLVRLPRRDEPRDLGLAPAQRTGTARGHHRRRSRAERAKLIARRANLPLRTQPHEHVVRAPQ